MAESELISDHPPLGENIDVKSENMSEISKEGMERGLQKNNHHETHGNRNDINENTRPSDVKGPNVFERAKEEFEAIVETIHRKKDSQKNEPEKRKQESEEEKKPEKDGQNLIEKAKEKIDSVLHHHHKESHGTNNDIDENTPLDTIKGPNVFERAKEELEAIVDAIHPKKENNDLNFESPEKEKAGFGCSIGKGLEKMCHPWGRSKRD